MGSMMTLFRDERYNEFVGSDRPEIALDSAGKAGLRNLGNSCFMNAGLQCLCHLEPLVIYFLSGKYRDDFQHAAALGPEASPVSNPSPSSPSSSSSSSPPRGELAEGFAVLMRGIWEQKAKSFNPKALYEIFCRRSWLFEAQEQQDVQEFLAFLLDGLHEDLNLVRKPEPYNEENDEKLVQGKSEEWAAALSWFRYLQRGKSFLVDLLQGQLRDELTCRVCGYSRRKFEAFLYLSVPVSRQMNTVRDAIRTFLEEEVLTGDERWHCPRCNKRVEATKRTSLWKLPHVLVLHLKRFEFDSHSYTYRKIAKLLSTDLSVDFKKIVSSEQREGTIYDVVAVANHEGEFGYGHYTANCRLKTSTGKGYQWYVFNDSHVKPISEQEVISGKAYVIFFLQRSCVEIRRQTESQPEVWPHMLSARNSVFKSFARPKSADPTSGMAASGNNIINSNNNNDKDSPMRPRGSQQSGVTMLRRSLSLSMPRKRHSTSMTTSPSASKEVSGDAGGGGAGAHWVPHPESQRSSDPKASTLPAQIKGWGDGSVIAAKEPGKKDGTLPINRTSRRGREASGGQGSAAVETLPPTSSGGSGIAGGVGVAGAVAPPVAAAATAVVTGSPTGSSGSSRSSRLCHTPTQSGAGAAAASPAATAAAALRGSSAASGIGSGSGSGSTGAAAVTSTALISSQPLPPDTGERRAPQRPHVPAGGTRPSMNGKSHSTAAGAGAGAPSSSSASGTNGSRKRSSTTGRPVSTLKAVNGLPEGSRAVGQRAGASAAGAAGAAAVAEAPSPGSAAARRPSSSSEVSTGSKAGRLGPGSSALLQTPAAAAAKAKAAASMKRNTAPDGPDEWSCDVDNPRSTSGPMGRFGRARSTNGRTSQPSTSPQGSQGSPVTPQYPLPLSVEDLTEGIVEMGYPEKVAQEVVHRAKRDPRKAMSILSSMQPPPPSRKG